MTNVKESVDGYFNMWNEEDSGKRADIIEQVWSGDAISVDPVAEVRGPDEINEMVASVKDQFPGHKFSQIGDIHEHHDRILFHWQMASPEGSVTLSGLDCVRVSEDRRFVELTGFFTGP